ncbi:hypothetical protein CAPTEDRAFT_166137 [Capitella teleta]|uniref:Presequence translocated-associated motor subunit PAM16 n=1 Tax=Capitella teleta TaxID=283909 RepID=R7UTX6_CAPTE|nr:hypothetical protein CAPTEDRAFT_166137 [Capitella teleta]|eukprot:ELU09583.1 hypothetical protein CAPTEDRAFT_166137 [Capitella teleta]
MAKYIAQIIMTGAQVVGRAFAKAVQQEIRFSQQAAKARASSGGGSAQSQAADAFTGMSVQEAKQILNIEDISDVEAMQKKYDHLFQVNDRKKGGSLYIQSKVVRAKERLDQELDLVNKKEEEPKTEEKS